MLDSETKNEIQSAVQDAFATQISFETEYEETKRKAGYTVPASPSPRDTIDEGDLLGSLDILETNTSVILSFDDEAHPLMEHRPELEEEILDQLPIGQIAKDIIKSYLKGKNL